jgi:N-acetylneuraminic acid mutarotase
MNKIVSLALIFLLICGSFIFVFSSVSSAASSVENSWNFKTQMSQARGGLGVVAVDGKIYAIGGKTVEGFVGINERYDPKTDTWTTMKAMPTLRAYFAIAAYGDKIYCIGGLNNGGACSVNEVYDIATDSWSTKASLPVNGKNLQGQMLDGKIFVIEGYNLFMYEPIADLWTKKAGLPASSLDGSNSIASAVVDNNIIVTSKFKVVLYDSNTDTWHEGKKPPSEIIQGVSGATTGVCAPNKIYTIGTITTQKELYLVFNQVSPGYVTSIMPIVEVYDPVKNTWSTVSVGINRVDFGVVVLDDILYVIGGYLIVFRDTTITVDVKESDPNVYFGYRNVPKQVVAQESVVGEPCAFNVQYVPIGYRVSSTVTDVVSPSNPVTSIGDDYFLNSVIIVVLVLIVGIATAGVFIYFRKRHT